MINTPQGIARIVTVAHLLVELGDPCTVSGAVSRAHGDREGDAGCVGYGRSRWHTQVNLVAIISNGPTLGSCRAETLAPMSWL